MCFYHTVLADHTISKLNWHVPATQLVRGALTCRQLVLDFFQTYFFNKQNSAEDWRQGVGALLFHLSIQNEISMTSVMLHYYIYSPGCQTQTQKAYKGTLEKASQNTVTYQTSSNTHPIILLEPGPRCDVPATAFLIAFPTCPSYFGLPYF